jgi:hypothetical protein
VQAAHAAGEAPAPAAPPANAGLQARVEILEHEVASLRAAVDELCAQLGMSPPGHVKTNDRADN